MAPVLNKRYTKIVENRRGSPMMRESKGTQGGFMMGQGANERIDKGVDCAFDNESESKAKP